VTDDSWSIVEEAVVRLFDEIAGEHTAIGPRLTELGWSAIETEYPIEACQLLFHAQGCSLAQTDCLDRVMLAEFAGELPDSVDLIVMPAVGGRCVPDSDGHQVSGIVLGPLHGRVMVPVPGPMGSIAAGVVDAESLHGQRLDTFDHAMHWTRVSGTSNAELIDVSDAWQRAVAAAQRALGTELIAVTEQILRIAVEHAKTRVQFGTPIGSFQSLRHALADACAVLEGARALVGESWRYGGQVSAQAAKATAGRAHRTVSGTALQVLGAIGLTAEHELHRYVSRGFQLDSLFGSHQELETLLAEQLFNIDTFGEVLPAIVACG
jgi:hypothetical protein